MPSNTNIITTTAKDAVQREVVNYGAGVYAHTTGDWSRHNVLRVYELPYKDAGGANVSVNALRLVLTLDNGTPQGLAQAFELPINPTGKTAITNSPPIIIQQPRDVIAPPGSQVQLQVAVISDIPVTYQWIKDGLALAGQTAPSLVIPSMQAVDQGLYKVHCMNANGGRMSREAKVQLGTGGQDDNEKHSFFEDLPHVKLDKFIFGFLR